MSDDNFDLRIDHMPAHNQSIKPYEGEPSHDHSEVLSPEWQLRSRKAALRQQLWELSRYMTLAGLDRYVNDVLDEIESDLP